MSREEKKARISLLLQNYQYQCDFIISSFNAAVYSQRYESRAVPYPAAFVNGEGDRNIEALRDLLLTIPPLTITQKLIPYNGGFDYIDILDWLFTIVDPRSLELTEINDDEAARLGLPLDNKPAAIFANRHTMDAENSWNRLKGSKNTFHAFYGTSLENIYSTLNHGLNPMFSTLTEPLYGEGIYLTNQISDSLLFSPYANVWRYSLLREKMRVLVLCEVIDDSSKIKRMRKNRTPEDPDNGSTYIIVKDGKFVRPKFFFLYSKTTPPPSVCSLENCARMLYVMFLITLVIWIYMNRVVLFKLLTQLFFKKK